MAMSITIAINVEENQRFTPVESAVIAALQTGTSGATAAADKAAILAGTEYDPAILDAAKEQAAEKAEDEKTVAEATAPEKPKRTRRTTKAAPAPEAEESTTPAVLDTTLDDDPIAEGQKLDEAQQTEELDPAEEQLRALENAPTYTLEQAVSIATELIGNGGKAKVKAALDTLQVGRVTELKDDAEGLSKFVELIQA